MRAGGEGQVRDSLLQAMARAKSERGMVRAAVRHTVAFLDFVEPSDASRRAGWWASFVGDASGSRVGKEQPASVAAFLRALVRQVAGGYRVLEAAMGSMEQAAAVLRAFAETPPNARHRRFIAELKNGTLPAEDFHEIECLRFMPFRSGGKA